MPLITFNEWGEPVKWADAQDEVIDLEPIPRTAIEMVHDILGPDAKHYFWLGQEAEDGQAD